MAIRVASYNIRFGGGRRIRLIGDVIRAIDVDVVLLQEATNPSAVDRIATIAGMPHVLRRPGWSVACLARGRIQSHAWRRPLRGRGFLEVEPSGSDLRLIGLHLPAGLSGRGERARLYHVDALLRELGEGADGRTVLMGDFNSIAPGDEPLVARMPFWLRMLLRFDGGIRTDVLRRLETAGWVDAYRRLHPDKPGFTLPPGAPSVRLDYLLAPETLIPKVTSCDPADGIALVERASDHLPLVSTVDV